MKALCTCVVALAAVALSSGAAAGSEAARQRVVIDLKIFPQSTFTLTTLQAGALKRDSGMLGGNWRSIPGRSHMRNGQRVTIFDGAVWTLTGKLGTLTIRDRNEWVDAGDGAGVAIGTWKVVRGTGQYAGVVGRGGNGHVGLGTPWYARYEGFLTLP